MIAKDEELTLPVCLRSVKDFVDEIVVVDTGSTDRTRDIALSFGCRIYDFEWVDDFSAARNFALAQVKTPWTLSLDADDLFLNPDRIKDIASACHHNRENAVWSTYLQDAETQQRRLQLFKTKDFRWEGVVHENPILKQGRENNHHFSDLKVMHRKPHSRCQSDAKRYLEILLKKDPENWLGIAESYRFLSVHPDNPEQRRHYQHQAEHYYSQAANHPTINQPTRYMALFQAAKIGMEMGVEYKDENWVRLAYRTCELAFHVDQTRAEAVVLLGQISQCLGLKENARGLYLEALKLNIPDGIGVVYDQYYRDIPARLLQGLVA